MPESFKVLVKELQALCLDMRVLDSQGNEFLNVPLVGAVEHGGSHLPAQGLGGIAQVDLGRSGAPPSRCPTARAASLWM